MQTHDVWNPATIAGIPVRNRAVLAPMSMVRATGDGVPTADMASHYRTFADGGFGLLISEGIYTDDPWSQAYARQPGLTTPEQVAGWRRVTDRTREAGVPMVAQLMHAGALSQLLADTVAPSAVRPRGTKMPDYGGEGAFPMPRTISSTEMTTVLAGFQRSARWAVEAGFDAVELHAANGYLLDQFITGYTNHRVDGYGGSMDRRVRFVAEVLHAVQAEVSVPVGVRLSQGKVNDHAYRWPDGVRDAEAVLVGLAVADFLHIASEGRDWRDGAMIGNTSIPAMARRVTGRPVIANGGMHDPEQASVALRDGHADLVSLARGALADPCWPRRLAS